MGDYMAKIKIKLMNNHNVNGVLYTSGIHNLDESIVKKIIVKRTFLNF